MDISVVIPFYNEEESADFVLDEVASVLRPMGKVFEVIAVEDGSTDRTLQVLQQKQAGLPQLKIVCHGRNSGQGKAFWTGFEHARGDLIVMLDGDGQNDFRDVPRMLELLNGHDAVIGQRLKRRDPFSKRFATTFAYHMRQIFLQDGIRDTSCSLKVLRRRVIDVLLPVEGFFLFIPFLMQQAGQSYVTLEVNHRPREKGQTKYRLRKLFFFKTLADLWFMWWYKKRGLLKTNEKSA